MTEALVKELTALHNSGAISGFIISRFVPGELKSGWIEQGITHKMVSPNLTDKELHNHYLIPGDRAARLAVDLNAIAMRKGFLVILGPPGIATEKFVALVDITDPENALDIIWWSRTQTLADIVRLASQHFGEREFTLPGEEPSLDYIEQMRSDAIDGRLECAVAVKIPKKPSETGTVVAKAEGQTEDDTVPLAKGDLSSLVPFSRIFSRWIAQLKLFKKIQEGLGTCVAIGTDTAQIALWDAPRSLASFAVQRPPSLSQLVHKYLSPLWTDIKSQAPPSKEPRASQPADDSNKILTVLTKLEEKLEQADVKGLQKSLLDFEKRISRLEEQAAKGTKPSAIGAPADKETTQKIRSLVTRLEEIAERLDRLEESMKAIIDQRE
ncbi:MAG: hypothetical protein K9W43_02850 [Candidatus Thorarchaeota archaeon]|nr:hypothetical protein [Candidatus Thorarchaeota archaeon]